MRLNDAEARAACRYDRITTPLLAPVAARGGGGPTAATHAPNLGGRRFAAALGYQEEVVMRGSARFDGRAVDRIKFGKLLIPSTLVHHEGTENTK